MTITWRLDPVGEPDVDAVVVPVYADRLGAAPAPEFLARNGFAGAVGATMPMPGVAGGPATIVLGIGQSGHVDPGVLRHAAGVLARATGLHRTLAINLPEEAANPAGIRAVVEGFLLGGYRFTGYRSTADPGVPRVRRVDLRTEDTPEAGAALRTGRLLADAVLLARDLVNEPGAALTPEIFAARAGNVAGAANLDCDVWDEHRIAAEQLGGLLGVGRSSPRPPRLVLLTYQPTRPTGSVALVGKGVTFDAGGLSLKPNAQLVDMKADMAGAAAVLGAMSVLADLDCPVRVTGWLPLTENMPNADPVRIGDVLRMRDGHTVEVRNADAEGRLIMADALALAGETAPDAIIDIATLTDAAPIALGRNIAALLGNDTALEDRVRAAADRAGESVWPLPLPRRYRRQLDSAVADLVNYTIGTRHGTALLAGLFLREFVPAGIPWAHLDIQGTALSDTDDGEWVRGGTGFGVRTLAELLLTGMQPVR